VGEPSSARELGATMKIGRRGSMNFALSVHGTQGHSAYPQHVDNPIHRLVRILDRLTGDSLDSGSAHFEPSTLQVTSVDVGNPATNVIPAQATAKFNVRFNDLHDSAAVERWVRERVEPEAPRFDLDVRAVGLDAGYATAGISQGLEERGILGVTGYRRPSPPRPGMMPKKSFSYEPSQDGYRCPQGQLLTYATTDRNGYRHYKSDPAICRTCPLLASCTSNANAQRTITRHVWQDARERADQWRKTPWGKALYKRRKETVERSFADAKQLHGHSYARFRGLTAVACQCLLAATAQNIKKIALALTRTPQPASA